MKLSATIITSFYALVGTANAFSSHSSQGFGRTNAFARSSQTKLYDFIEYEAGEEGLVDEGLGGVRLVQESAVKINGIVDGSSHIPEAKDLTHYTKVTELSEASMKDITSKAGVTIISTGTGNELYKDPGTSTLSQIVYAPSEAVTNALSSAPNASVSNAKKVVFNFVGGDDLMIFEVVDAIKTMVDGLDISQKKTEIIFNSLCHSQFPNEMASVTVTAISGDSTDTTELTGAEKCASMGEIYFHQGKYWTVTEEDSNNITN
mmetsp:Transcript_741/g.680  ORF Transcript_741/g.680 Transcript_741/m.680 type:complete len:262 (-) Transcript_741:7-792(-)|eukprot:CAMPEP_0197824118 /NCGR_PEP_ID=MMETSP1437-20131217/1423_1 /TAXON_ID=49252 ORGANISM="Eucampia antarctica, Strain CCMP1452" /NCGR_SAMPLE_ID=MMETSP1437 /ASSEMBLY_ACC=CAM_ASM_001096 /LENGTH=261 /DNA_ID=CAMNT_0043423627 /DNA_START=162 /DNA_END=947 /DNA_ORIENTATION=+